MLYSGGRSASRNIYFGSDLCLRDWLSVGYSYGASLGVVMIVAIISAKWSDVDSLETLAGFEETTYLAVFLWLAIAGAGIVSGDHWLHRRFLGKTSA